MAGDENNALRAREIYKDARRRLITVETVEFQHNKSTIGWQIHGDIKPVAMIVCGPDRNATS